MEACGGANRGLGGTEVLEGNRGLVGVVAGGENKGLKGLGEGEEKLFGLVAAAGDDRKPCILVVSTPVGLVVVAGVCDMPGVGRRALLGGVGRSTAYLHDP